MWTALIPIIGDLLARIIPDPAERAKVEAEMRAQAAAAEQAQIELVKEAVKAQGELAIAETNQGTFWNSWRPAFAWIMVSAIFISLILSPLLNAGIGVQIQMDHDLLQEVAGWWMAIYMGGHTVKYAVGHVADAMKAKAK
jgi:hypothetical protein